MNTMNKEELNLVLESIKNNPKDLDFVIKNISKILRGNDEEFKVHHIVEEVWSLKETLKHFSLTKPVAVIKEGTVIVLTEDTPENVKLYPLPTLGLNEGEINHLIDLASKEGSVVSKSALEKLRKL